MSMSFESEVTYSSQKMCAIKLYIAILIASVFTTDYVVSEEEGGYHPCCSFPCQNKGVCMSRGFSDYECDCLRTGYYGRNCEHATILTSIVQFLRPSHETKHHLLVNYKWFWDLINSWEYLHGITMKMVYLERASNVHSPPLYTSSHEYVTLNAAYNHSHYARALPPVHKNCPTPMGVAGKKMLPDPQLVVDRIFKRLKFKPDSLNHSVHLPSFGQHFTHQFFKTDLKMGHQYQWGGHGVDASHIYGKNEGIANMLRSFEGGRLKSQIIKGEEYPPYIKDAPVIMTYPPNTPETQKFALGHEFYGLLPNLFLYATMWLREHNRVVGILAKKHPDWSDEQLYHTGKLVIVGETIQIVISDYVQHLSNYHIKLKFKPEQLFHSSYQYQNRIALEFNHLYHWHPMMPDQLKIGTKTYTMREALFHPEIVVEHGVTAVTDAFTKQISGKMTYNNHGETTIEVVKQMLIAGRELRLQSFNQYRKRFGLSPYTSFLELTGNQEVADLLKELYGDIDGVEFYVGLVTEKHAEKGKVGITLLMIGASYSVKGLLSNPICSPDFWKPSTFGGQIGFDIIKNATLHSLFCNNIKGKCPNVSFKVPEDFRSDRTCNGGVCQKEEL